MIQQTLSLSNDEIARGEYFSHANEPMLTFNPVRNLIYVNAVCLRRLPDMDYALIVISASKKRLSIYPCETNELNAVRLRSGGVNRNKPRRIRCHADFLDKMLSLMQWSHDCQYRIIGYVATGNNNSIIVFDLSSAEVFAPRNGSTDTPAQLHKGFGCVFDEQRNNPLIRTISQDTEISLEEMEEKQDDNR